MSVLQGDALIGKHPLDLLSRASNAELASIGNYGTGAYARFYHSNDANQGSMFGINAAGDLFGSNIAGGVSRLRIDQIQIGSIASTDNATSNLAFNNVNLTGLCNVQIIGSLLDKDGNPYSLSGGSGSGGFADYAVYLPYNPASEAVRVIQTNDTALANRVLFSLTLPAGRYYLNGVIPYTNLDSLVPINSTNWASVNIYNGTLAMYTGSTATLVQATPFFSTTAVVGATQYLAFTVFVDTLADSPTAQNFVVAVEGTGHRLAFTLADVTVKGIPVQTSTGLGTSAGDSILVSRKISIAPIRTVTAIPEGETSNAFNISIPGNFVATASNTDVYLNGTKYVYQDATNYDYSVVYNYNAINDTTLFTVALSGDALAGDIVDITVWPEAYTSNYFVSGKFYQSTAVTSSPWQKVVSSVPSIRYPGNLIVDGTIFLGGDIYGGCNVRDFTSGIEFDRSVLGTLSCNIIGTLNLANYSVTPAKLNLTGGNVGVGTTIPVQTLDVRGSIRLDGAMYDASNNPIWLPSSSIQWNASPTPPTFTMPGGAVLSYGRSNGVYRWIGDDFAYNINVSATVATAPGGPLTPAGSNYLLTLPYPVLSASYPTATIIGDLWLTTTNPTEGAGTSNMFKAYAATIPTNANSATIRALTGTTDESLAVLSVGTQFTLQGTLVYRTTTINQSFTVPALYTQSSVIQDQDGNLGINLPPPTMPRGGFDIYSSNAVIPALVVDQRSTGDIVSLREGGVTVVTVDGNGNVGIGTTTPIAPLHVHMNSSNPAAVVDQYGTGDILRIRDSGTAVVTVDGNGNVGIGTTLPIASLNVTGNTFISGSVFTTGTTPFTRMTWTRSASFSWTVPDNVYRCDILLVGGGGGGGGRPASVGSGGGGGGAGAMCRVIVQVVPGDVFTVVVGAGGAGTQTNGTNGTSSTVTISGGKGVITATGGSGGKVGTAGSPGNVGQGGFGGAEGSNTLLAGTLVEFMTLEGGDGSCAIPSVPSANIGAGGSGGGSLFGTGGTGATTGTGTVDALNGPRTGRAPGSGGGGASSGTSAVGSSAGGAAGICIISY